MADVLVVTAHPRDFVSRAGGAIALAVGHEPEPDAVFRSPQVHMFEPTRTAMSGDRPDVLLNLEPVRDVKRRASECLPAQTHLWGYHERVALNRGQQATRKSGRKVAYGEACQRIVPEALDVLR